MTRAVRDRILKDANGDISDHLRNHIHLTNCIHLKNHMHKPSLMLSDRMLMRDLVVLQRSRSLRDPSTSPPSLKSPSVADLLSKRCEKAVAVGSGRLSSLTRAKVAPDDVSRCKDGAVTVTSSKSRVRDHRRINREEASGRKMGTGRMHGNGEPPQDAPGSSQPKDKKIKLKRMHKEEIHLKTLSEQLNEFRKDSDDVASSHIHLHRKHTQNELTGEEAESNLRGNCIGLKRVKRRKFRGTRRTPAMARNVISVASNSLAQGSARQTYHMEAENEEYAGQNVTRAPRNGCGIPLNWSRIHDRGRTFLDMAGRSFSCGLPDSRLKRDGSEMPVMSEHSSSSIKSESEALPLLMQASGSKESTYKCVHDYSGELGIFADNLLKRENDSDLASEAGYSDQNTQRRHQNLTQNYMPRTFRDLVGQNLVAQALSNAVIKRKVGLLYVFYGPHGTGKTSCARIFARALNCQSLEHPKPCGFCNSCIKHDMGKSRNIKEVGPVSNFDFESIMDLLDNMILSQPPSQYRVFIVDDCDTLSSDCWNAISKVIDVAPRRVVFVLVSSSLDVLPHMIISRCQRFFFPKLKDADIVYTLQWIATKEELEIDKDALKLIASRSDGSLRDAEMTLEQLSLLGQRISVPLVQELVGLISDEKLVDLLDLALSADTVNTVKNLREIMESGVEPLALMSQLATVITDILAGSYDLTKERPRRKFFQKQALYKDDMEKLRQALKTLSEAEKQLRMSNDRLTWLTAALLQLAPDQQYMLPSSSADTSLNHRPLGLNNAGGRERPRKGNVDCADMPSTGRELATDVKVENFRAGSSSEMYYNGMMKGSCSERKQDAGVGTVPQKTFTISADMNKISGKMSADKVHKVIKEIWLEVLEKIQINSVKEFMCQEGKLICVSFGAAPTVQLMFGSRMTKSMAEQYKSYILQAFESVLGSPVTIDIRCEATRDSRAGINVPLMPTGGTDYHKNRVMKYRDNVGQAQFLQSDSPGIGKSEIIEIVASPREPRGTGHIGKNIETERRDMESDLMGESASLHKKSAVLSLPEQRKLREQNQNQSLVRRKVSLAHVLQQAENGWSKRKAISIAEKLEQENLRLEPRSRSLLCWKASRVTRRKLSHSKTRKRKPHTLLKFVSCGKCLSAKSPR